MTDSEHGFIEWFRVKVGLGKIVTIDLIGQDEITPHEIGNLIELLKAQKKVLEGDSGRVDADKLLESVRYR